MLLRDDKLVVQTKRGELICYSHDDATPLWRHQIQANYEVPLIGQEELVVTFDENGVTRALSVDSGTELWTYDGGQGPSCKPGATNHSVLIPTRRNEIHFLETKSPLARGGK